MSKVTWVVTWERGVCLHQSHLQSSAQQGKSAPADAKYGSCFSVCTLYVTAGGCVGREQGAAV